MLYLKTYLTTFSLYLCFLAGNPYLHAEMAWFDAIPLPPSGYYDGADGAGGFTEDGIHFNNQNPGGFWSGFAVSNIDFPTAGGPTNQYASYLPGTDVSGSGNYGVVFADPNGFGITPTARLPRPSTVQGLYVNNAAYTALSMLDGDQFAKKFGGNDGNDPDWLKLTITGHNRQNNITGSLDYYLADYRFPDNTLDYVVNGWEWLDLTSLGSTVTSITFGLDSSDRGQFGVNTPAYFVIDQLAVIPEPASWQLLGFAVMVFLVRGKWKKHSHIA